MAQPDKQEQILQSHAGLIHRVVMHCNNPGSVPDMEQVLQMAADNDWTTLVTVIRDIMSGNRDESMLALLDEEDRIITESIRTEPPGMGTPTAVSDSGSKRWIMQPTVASVGP